MSTKQVSEKQAVGAKVQDSPRRKLQREPYRFDFFQAVRLLSLAALAESEHTGAPRRFVGEDFRPEEEVVRFRSLVSHAFPSSMIAAFDDTKTPAEMVVTFMGMTGPSGVLPQHYTQTVIDRVRKKDFALRDFLDLFNHRVVSYFYRAWVKNNFAVSYETAVRRGQSDPYLHGLFSIIGQGTDGLLNRLDVPDEGFLYYGGQFARHPKSAISLEEIVSDYFRLPARVLQFCGQWLQLSESDQTSMPSFSRREGLNNQLGFTAIAGERVWSVESKFRIRLGPLTLGQFRRYTPTGDRLRALAQTVRRYAGTDLDFDVQLVLLREEVPMCRLGGDSEVAAQLGWTTWIHNEPFPADSSDAVFFDDGMPTR